MNDDQLSEMLTSNRDEGEQGHCVGVLDVGSKFGGARTST